MPQAQSVAVPKRLPLVIEPENREDSTSFDARLVNAFVETKGTGESAEYWIYERPGLLELSQPPAAAAAGLGVVEWLGNIYSIFANKLYKNGVVVTGTVDTTGGVYRFDSCLGGTPKLQMGNGVFAYNYDDAAGLVLISDADFPAAFKKGWGYLDGTTYLIIASAHIYGDDLNDPVNWDPLNDILAQIEPDQGVALSKQLVYIIAFKQWTTEVFYDAGNSTGSPLGRVEGAKINHGCQSQDTVRELGGMLLWVGSTRQGSPQVLLLDNLRAQVVSTKPIERLLEQADFTSVFTWTLKLDGHSFYILTLVAANLTLAYDVEERRWCQWTDSSGNYFPIVDSCVNSTGQHILHPATDGKLYYADPSYATDDGSLITVDIITPNFDGGVRRKKLMSKLEIIADQRVGSELLVRVNDHDYNSTKWTNWRRLDLSQRRPFITDCGSFDRRVHQFRHKSPIRMPRIQAVEMQIDLGTL